MIIIEKNIKESTKRLEKLKNATIDNYLEDVDLDDERALYDELIKHFVEGDLDDEFSFSVVDDMEQDDKKILQDLTRKYISLCFYDGSVENWTDSVENVPEDYDFITLKILDNYNFLLEIARDGGEAALKELKEFQKCEGYHENAVIDYLRNTFLADTILRKAILEMTKKDSLYKVFTATEKASLCRFPEGCLYSYDWDKEKIRFTSPLKLALEINRQITAEEFEELQDKPDLLFEALAVSLRKIGNIDEVVLDMNAEYLMQIAKTPKEVMQFIKKIEQDSKHEHIVLESYNQGEDTNTLSKKRK